MNTHIRHLAFALASITLGSLPLAAQHEGHHTAAAPQKLIAVLHPASGSSVTGSVTFTQTADGVVVEAEVKGLEPGKHGFHIHQFGDCSAADATSAGGHFNPHKAEHSGPDAEKRHAGDLGNIEADASGAAKYRRTDMQIKLDGPESILGRSVIVHEKEDDLKTQPTGNAGARVACGVIGIAKAE